MRLIDLQPGATSIRGTVIDGLLARQKTLPCALLYDRTGCELFDRICGLPEYYLTRCELSIMRRYLHEMAAALGSGCAVVEFGSGKGIKSRLLLGALQAPVAYVPIDIARETLARLSAELSGAFGSLEVLPVCADYTQTMVLPRPRRRPQRWIVYFPGSTIGNLHPGEAVQFLRKTRGLLGSGGAMLIGIDLKKDHAVLQAAYNDAQGVTAAFNKNILARINRELGADFDADAFTHRASYNERHGRIEMHLVSRARQTVMIDGVPIRFAAGETILTEHSYKYDVDQFARLARHGGFQLDREWTDDDRMFSVLLLSAAAGRPLA